MKNKTKTILIGLTAVILVTSICLALLPADKEREILIISENVTPFGSSLVVVCYTDRTVEAYISRGDYDIAENTLGDSMECANIKLMTWEYVVVRMLAEVIGRSDVEHLCKERYSTDTGYFKVSVKGRVIETPMFTEPTGAYAIFIWFVESRVNEARIPGIN